VCKLQMQDLEKHKADFARLGAVALGLSDEARGRRHEARRTKDERRRTTDDRRTALGYSGNL